MNKSRFKRLGIILLCFSVLVEFSYSFVLIFLGFHQHNIKFIQYSKLAEQGLTIFCFLAAIGLFAWIGSQQIGYHRWINTVAATTFGIYLIHDNKMVRDPLWLDLLHMKSVVSQPVYVVLYVLFVCLIIFLACALLEYIREFLFKKLEDRISISFENSVSRLVNKILTVISKQSSN